MEWLKNLSNAIAYIERHIDSEISYEEAARIACCSTYYFQRMFSYVAGISLSEYIRRRRMSQAAFDLQRKEIKVMEVALKYGYTSPTSFNRAFQNVHGITPTAARTMGCPLRAYPPIHFSVKITGGSAMSYHIAEKNTLRFVGVRIRLCEDMEENQSIVPYFWEEVLQSGQFTDICQLTDEGNDRIFGLSVYENPDNIFYYIAVASSAAAPQGMFAVEIPAAAWVVFENDGQFKENVQNIFRRFYTEWLPFSGYEYTGLPEVEVYPILTGTPVSGHCDVWIAIKKEIHEKEKE